MRKRKPEELKDSDIEWFGEIPNGWNLKKIKYLSDIDPEELSNSTDPDYRFKYVDISSVNSLGKIEEYQNVKFADAPSRARKKVKLNDIIVSTVRTYLKAVTRINTDLEDIICSTGFSVLRAEQIDPGFLFYSIISNGFIDRVEANSVGVSYPAISSKDLGDFKIHLPEIEEQKAITTFLDRKTEAIDQLIEKKQQLIEMLKEKRQALITRAVTKGLNPGAPMKESGITWLGEIPEHWEVTQLKFMCSIYGRIGFRGYTTDDIVDKGDGPITLSPSNIKNDTLTLTDNTYISWEKYHESPEIKVYPSDIILVKTGSTIGKTAYIPDKTPKMTINPQLVVLKNIKGNPEFLYYQSVCPHIKNSFLVEQAGGSTPSISQEKIKSFPCLNIPREEQDQIADYLHEVLLRLSSTTEKITSQIYKLKEYRHSLISAAVTGKIDVRDEFPELAK